MITMDLTLFPYPTSGPNQQRRPESRHLYLITTTKTTTRSRSTSSRLAFGNKLRSPGVYPVQAQRSPRHWVLHGLGLSDGHVQQMS
jgi:hypothetical protein